MSTEIIVTNEQPSVTVYNDIIEVSVLGTQMITVNVLGGTGPAGQQGANGTSATVTVGTVTTGAAGTQASVTNVGTSTNAILNFTIPQGVSGSLSLSLQSDYDYDISGNRNGNNKVFQLSNFYVNGTTKVYVNGLRQTPGANYDYEEIGSKQIRFTYNIDYGDLITADYLKQ